MFGNEVKEVKGGFISILVAALGARLLANMVTVKGVTYAAEETIRAG